MTRFHAPAAFALATGLFVAAGIAARQPKPVPVPAQPVAELPLVPKGAAAFVSLKVSDLIDHPDLKPALEQLKKTPEALDGVTELVGIAPHEIDRVTLFWPAVGRHGPGDPVLVVTTREAYNEARVLKNLRAEPVFAGGPRHGPQGRLMPERVPGGFAPKAATKPDVAWPPKPEPFAPPVGAPKEPPKPAPGDRDSTVPIFADVPTDPVFYELDRGPFRVLFLVDERTLVFLPGDHGDELVLLGQLMRKKPTGPLADAVAAGGRHTLAAGVYLTPLFGKLDRGLPGELAPYAALTAARTAVVTGDLGKTAKVTLTMTFEDAAAARRAGPVLEEGLRTLAGLAAGGAAGFKDHGRSEEKALAPLLEAAAAGLKGAGVRAEGTAVVAAAAFDVGPPAAKAVGEFLASIQSRKRLDARANNLKQIGLALHSYHDVHNKFPSNVYGPKGEPLLSWRVQLLPYLEQDALYRRFKMDEAWDGPNNKPLAEQMPAVFDVPDRPAPKGKTFYQAFLTPDPRKRPANGGPVGRTWLVEGGQGSTFAAISDGLSNTIGVAEARDAVVWSKPGDLTFGEKLPSLGAEGADRFLALMLDGSVRAVPTKLDPEILRRLIDAQDGHVIPDWDDDRRGGLPFGGAAGEAATPKVTSPPPPKE